MGTVKTLAHVWPTEAEAIAAQNTVNASQGIPEGDTLNYQTIQFQEDNGWWMQADSITAAALGTANLQVIDEIVNDDF